MKRVGSLLVCLLPSLILARADPPGDGVGIREVSVPLVEGNIHSRDLFQEVLRAGGSDVELPEGFPNQKIAVDTAAARLSLNLWNVVLDEYGIRLFLEQEAVRIRIDLNTIDGKLDEFEQAFTAFFGIERTADFLRLSPPDTKGPVVVFLHGLDSGRRFFKGTCDRLVAEGYDVYFFEYPNDDKVAENARRLSGALQTLPPDRREDITLLTHSMGGVISQLMIETPELYVPGVKRLIACAPPFKGSEMAALRMVVEMGDHAMGMLLDPEHGFSFFGDGMGRAGIDLQPDSLLMDQLARLERNPEVAYSILAGNRGMVDPTLLRNMREEIRNDRSDNPVTETARRLMLERIEVLLAFQTGNGDGAVTLESATLEGVTDRVVLPLHHLQFLSGLDRDDPIGALDEVMKRLPPVWNGE